MKKKTFISVVSVLVAIILVLTGVVIANAVNRHQVRKTFLNATYVYLRDVATGVDTLIDGGTAPRMHDRLMELHVRCWVYALETNQAFAYPMPGVFETICSEIEDGAYSAEQMQALSDDLWTLVNALSDASGTAENDAISNAALNEAFDAFLDAWQ